VPAVAHPRTSEERYTSWDRARLSVLVPIGVIVAVAIVCIVVAVLSSAQRADEVAVQHEKLSFSRALTSFGERVLREVKSIAASDRAVQNISVGYDSDWVKQRVGRWLKTYFDHDHVFVFDGSDKLVYSQIDRNALDRSWFEAALPDLRSAPCRSGLRPRM
jgi:sensor domain CHASE-containing protein